MIALLEYQRLNLLPVEVTETSLVLEKINKLFDLMNSSTTFESSQKSAISKSLLPFKTIVSVSITVLKYLILRLYLLQEFSDMISFVKSWSFEDNAGKRANHSPVIDGLLTTLKALQSLAAELLTSFGFHWFGTRRCTQDHLEVFMNFNYRFLLKIMFNKLLLIMS